MGLALKPRLLILDEPTQGLSDGEIEDFVGLVREIARDATVLLIEHNMEVVMRLADRITVMNAGKILAEGTPEQIRANAEVQRAYLGTTAAMTDALTISGLDCFYGEVQVLHGLDLELQAGRGALPARPQRRRQDDDAEGDHGAGAGALRLDQARRRRTDRACRRTRCRRPASPMCRRAGGCSPR